MKNLPIKLGIIITIFTLIHSSCGHKESLNKDSGSYSAARTEMVSESSDGEKLKDVLGSGENKPGSSAPLVTERKLIKNGDISFETKSLSQTKMHITKMVAHYNGYISNERVEDYKTNPTEMLTVRIPNSNFDKFIKDISETVGELDSKHINIDDVTEQFVDIEARLKNKKQLELKYQELLAKATNMENILSIEKEISLIREDIESTEGRLRYLNNQVGYSTLQITYYVNRPSRFNFFGKVGHAFSDGGKGLLWFIIGMIQLWPLWLISSIVWYIIYKLIKRRKTKVR